MIIRKPYAFMIKHFRAIHLILLIPIVYLIIKSKAIISFFTTYIANDYSISFIENLSNLASNYINVLMYVSIIIILAVLIVISILLQQKGKPHKFYNYSIIYYLILFLILTACFSIFAKIETSTIDELTIRLVRDIGFIIHYSQYIFLVFILVRGTGFNIKKFNFKSDLLDLNISSEDYEEVEFLVGKDLYKTKRSIRRFFRELKYYYLENKFIFTIIFTIIIVVFATMLYMNRKVYAHVYKANEVLVFGNLNIKVKNAYITTLTKNGKELKHNKAYVVVLLEIRNRYQKDREFNYSNFNLIMDKQIILADQNITGYFTDYGAPFTGTQVKAGTVSDYYLVYEIDKNDIKNKIELQAYSHFDNSIGGVGVVTKKIKVNAKVENFNVINNNVSPGVYANLRKTSLKETTATIKKDYIITNRYEYQICDNQNNCLTNAEYINYGNDYNKTLLVLDYDLLLDENTEYYAANRDYKSFFNDFLEIKYTYNGKEYSTKVTVTNPNNYKEKIIVKVPSIIKYASKIKAVVTVRNISYSFLLSD